MKEKVDNVEEEIEDQVTDEESSTLSSEQDDPKTSDDQDETEGNADNDTSDDESEDDSEDETIITLGDEETPPQDETKEAPRWVKEVRKENRTLKKQLREFQKDKEARDNPAGKVVELGAKPKLDDYDFDTDKYDADLNQWYERKREVDDQNAKQKATQDAEQKAWQERLNSYEQSKVKLGIKDYDEVEHNANEALSDVQRSIILQGSSDPAAMMYILGKNTVRLKEISGEKDFIKFAFSVAKLETKLNKTTRKRAATSPEKRVTNSGGGSTGSADKKLEELREAAVKSGDFTKVAAHKRLMRNKS